MPDSDALNTYFVYIFLRYFLINIDQFYALVQIYAMRNVSITVRGQ